MRDFRYPIRLLGLIAVLAFGPGTLAQDDAPTVDDAAYIRGLLDMGMTQVVDQLASHPSSNVEEAAGLRDALIDLWLPQRTGSVEQYLQGVKQILEYHKKMLDDPANADHYGRAMWSADLAQRLMFSALPSYWYAGDFELLGFPNANQKVIADFIAQESYRMLSEAEDEHFRLIRVLRARENFVYEIVNTGRLDAMQRYMDFNVPYYRAWAIALLLTQDEKGPYFARQPKAKAHRQTLLKLANRDVNTLVGKAPDMNFNDDTMGQLHLLRAHLALHRGAGADAIAALDKGETFKEATDYTKALIGMTRAKALRDSNQAAKANTLLDELAGSVFFKTSPLHQVIVADQRFIPKFEAANKADGTRKTQLINQAFDVYVDLFNSGVIAEDYVGTVRTFIEERYKDQIPAGTAVDDLPAVVRSATVRQQYEEAEALAKSGQADAAKTKYLEAAATASALVKSAGKDMGNSLHAEMLFYKGVSELRAQELRAALLTFLDLGEQFPDTQRGEQAAGVAFVTLAKPAYERVPDDKDVQGWYERSMKVLVEKYPTTNLGKLATYDYAAFLRVKERYADAVAAYAKVPKDHPAYLNAQYESLACRAAQWSQAAGGDKAALAPPLLNAVNDYVNLAEPQLLLKRGEERTQLREHIGSAILIRAQVMTESAQNPAAGLKAIEQVEKDYGDLPGLKPRILSLTIRIKQLQDQYAEAEQLLITYMDQAPDQAGLLAVSVLNTLNDQVEQLNAEGGQADKVAKLADIAVNLADKIVLPWVAKQEKYSTEEKLSFEIIPAQSLLAAGKHKQALSRFEAIVKKFGEVAQKNIDIVLGSAECYYFTRNFREASKRYNLIIKHITDSELDKSDLYWQSMMRIYQMMDQQSGGKNSAITRGINRLRRVDDNLGGNPYKTELNRLRDKHSG